MASPSMVQRSGDELIVRSVVSGDRLYTESGSKSSTSPEPSLPEEATPNEEPSAAALYTNGDDAENADLPQCKIKRNYDCADCEYFTQNPRHYLSHLRDVHGEKVTIYNCPNCLYASKHYQKLLRHRKMVHGADKSCQDSQTTTLKRKRREPKPKPNEEDEESVPCKKAKSDLTCTLCDFVAGSQNLLSRHERKEHSKTKLFPCSKCNYVTHIKARYTKHVKYHSMPMIKCEVCDFRTPYKWNLDRHMKNHGGTGDFCCSACNFTADIKQSLTVHEMNHHVPSVGNSATESTAGVLAPVRRRNRVGGSDSQSPGANARAKRSRLHPRNKLSRPTDELQDDLAEITLSSKICPDIDNKHHTDDMTEMNDQSKSCESNEEHFIAKVQPKKTPRPIPNLIPLTQKSSPPNSSPLNLCTVTPNALAMDFMNVNRIHSAESSRDALSQSSSFDNTTIKENDEFSQNCVPTVAKYVQKKKNSSIFDKLFKEKFLTVSNGDSLQEKECSNVETRTYQTNSGSTRCQHCRHRCKSSSDLVLHMETCPLANKERESPALDTFKSDLTIRPVSEEEASVDEQQMPHPMENIVFVWNSMLQKGDSFDNPVINTRENNSESTETPKKTPSNVETSKKEKELPNAGKKVFKCPHCSFWALTASRFHVHIVGHLNKKPFECSLCSYKSNWRWDITKHIRLKSVRDPDHAKAKVLMTDETGRRNYSKYNKYLTLLQASDSSADVGASGNRKNREMIRVVPDDLDTDTGVNGESNNTKPYVELHVRSKIKSDDDKSFHLEDNRKNKKSTWKCKKCDYRNTSKDALLMHVRKHSKSSSAQHRHEKQSNVSSDMSEVCAASDASSTVSYRCGHCNQVSNWKHVIQRHCRLKHNGDVKVIMGTKHDKYDDISQTLAIYDMKCSKCPFTTATKHLYENHLKQHTISHDSNFKCFICPYYVKSESDLLEHLPLHGISEPEKYGAQIVSCKSATETVQMKRYKCSDCPYESNSRSQFTYHEQFHKAHNAPFKCEICNYKVTKRHLLHQHMKVHGYVVSNASNLESNTNNNNNKDSIPKTQSELLLFWVSHNGEFQKMYKCRSCPYVNSRKTNTIDHEKMHTSNETAVHKCSDCTYASNNLDSLLSHAKVHEDEYAKVFYRVDSLKTDEAQISELKELMNGDKKKNLKSNKVLHFCSDCPARFLFEKELQIHYKFHCVRLPYRCDVCSYSARQHTHLSAHSNVHLKEYSEKTETLKETHEVHPEHPQPKLVAVNSESSEPLWIVVADSVKKIDTSTPKSSTKQYTCDRCPAKFFKSAALNYHLTLHGGQGHYKCKQCNYAVKTIGNLAKHEIIHGKTSLDYESGDDINYKNVPLSGTDLYQHKTKAEKRALSEKLITRPNDHFPPVLHADPQFGLLMHGNPDFIYPTYLKNGRTKEKRYKCHKCPSAFEKREQYKVHLSLHGSKQRYKCELCDYSVKYYANYVQHMRKHQMNADAHAARNGVGEPKSDTKLAIKSLPKSSVKDSSKLSMSDRQTLKLLHRRQSSLNTSSKEVTEDKKVFRCTHCPYTNQRRDALDNHMRRHVSVSGISSNFACSYCDYAAPQAQFLRDHTKLHFNHAKHVNPEYFANFEGLQIFVDKDPQQDKQLLFTMKENFDTSNWKETGNKIYVVPTSGERVTP